MTDTKPNAELAYRALDLALKHRDHFDMANWSTGENGSYGFSAAVGIKDLTSPDCGTTACLAGWVAALSGLRVDGAANLFTPDGMGVGVKADEYAAKQLGISMDEAENMFFASNDHVIDAVAEIFGPRPIGAP